MTWKLGRPAGLLAAVLLFSLTAAAANAQEDSVSAVDSLRTGTQEYMRLRGLERAPRRGSATLRTIGNVVLFLPRTVVDGLLFSTGFGARLVDDSKFIDRLADFVYVYERRVGWYPVVLVGSGDGAAAGATVFYRARPTGASLGGYFGGADFWQAKINVSHGFQTGDAAWRLTVTGIANDRPDYEFNGFGANPLTDPRNALNPGVTSTRGLYGQRMIRGQIVLGVRPAADWELFYTGMYSDRELAVPDNASSSNIDQRFDLGQLPGFAPGGGTEAQINQLYNEIAIRFDTRARRGQIHPGVRIEGYGGVSTGMAGDESRFARGGLDVALYVPVIRRNRLLVPRVIVDALENLDDNVPVPFTEYARHLSFRGTSPRTMLRADNIMVQPSIEYQWPLSFNVRGHLFLDYLLVARRFADLTFSGAPYAYGLGFDVHSSDSEVGRLSISNGSEGLRIFLSIGLSTFANDRTKWN